MPYEVRTGRAHPRVLFAREPPISNWAPTLCGCSTWSGQLREQGVATGHNVVVYYGGEGGTMSIDAGVEAFTDFSRCGEVRPVSTPPGEVATTAHYGEYSGMARAYAALEQWCAGHGRWPTGVNWEVYGDWDDDPAKRRTDIYFLLESATR